MLAAIIHWDGINNNEELHFDTYAYNVVIVKQLTRIARINKLQRNKNV